MFLLGMGGYGGVRVSGGGGIGGVYRKPQKRAVRILLECVLVQINVSGDFRLNFVMCE